LRYFVVETGQWLLSRKVLISPIAIEHVDWLMQCLSAKISKEQVKNSPDIDTDQPISKQHEMNFFGYYGHPYYWNGGGLWGAAYFPNAMRADSEEQKQKSKKYSEIDIKKIHHVNDRHLRSSREVIGYHVHAKDGDIGHVDSVLVDDKTWTIKYFVINTGIWWLGHQVLVSREWVTCVCWEDKSITVDVTLDAIRNAPTFESTSLLNNEDESRLCQHFGKDWPID